MMGLLGYSFRGAHHGLWKGDGVRGSGGVCQHSWSGKWLGNGYIFFFSSLNSATKKIAGIASSFAMEWYGRAFYSISGLKKFGLRLHHQPA